MTSKEKITDIQYLINEFYSTQESRGELNENSKASRKIFNQYCKDIKKDLEVLEILKKHSSKLDDEDWYGNVFNGIDYEDLDEEETKAIKEWLEK